MKELLIIYKSDLIIIRRIEHARFFILQDILVSGPAVKFVHTIASKNAELYDK